MRLILLCGKYLGQARKPGNRRVQCGGYLAPAHEDEIMERSVSLPRIRSPRHGAMCPPDADDGEEEEIPAKLATTPSACPGSPSSPRRCHRRSGLGGRRGRLALC